MIRACVLALGVLLVACGGRPFAVVPSDLASDGSTSGPDDSPSWSTPPDCGSCSQAERDSSPNTALLDAGAESTGTEPKGEGGGLELEGGPGTDGGAGVDAAADVEQLSDAAAPEVHADAPHDAAAPIPCTSSSQCPGTCPVINAVPCCSSAHVCACPTLALVCP